ncbi:MULTISPECIES: aminomethyl-transferring glycine dehydrogenase [unclassified Marinobacterium]|uniref:aminomethyl-transferring glycine dehydrogenase n=1 Tax=unclassified Marinobacterium TaxID=2644139 RepID=UPI0015680FD1|nr:MULTISPECIES: aminomethyl-transferring glycine dehydrogenase [unclassified Marinobacterium]NRP09944.1 Glycine dehydrogenase (decarboxylating) [Marinobacterium sp. xm-g-48]NRP82788.1 Glycine dehydrogenase (decarboxylating) [Marinobacterium sp. xm-d-509]
MPHSHSTLQELRDSDQFIQRHLGSNDAEQLQMCSTLDVSDRADLIQKTVPESILLSDALSIGNPVTEVEALSELKQIAAKNQLNKNFIGMGYYGTLVPGVIQRNVLENPAWYTAYTPYQPEISQGRLESLLNFQQMVMDLTGMDLANASLLDEATAAAEAMTLLKRSNRKKSDTFFVDSQVHPQTLDVIQTRAEYFGIEVVVDDATNLSSHDCFGCLVQYPGSEGEIIDLASVVEDAKAQGALVAVATDLLALMLLKSPGSLGADVALGSAQRFGVPMGFGGPHAAFFATSEKLKRSVPGRIIGVSIDSRGNQAYRMAMQTREQHIRREKATSNICTAQALLANMAAFYAIYHGPVGLKKIATRVHRLAQLAANQLNRAGLTTNTHFFDTLSFDADATVYQRALDANINLRKITETRFGVSFDETHSVEDVAQLVSIITGKVVSVEDLGDVDAALSIPTDMIREDEVLSHPVFNRYHAEHDILRYMKRLENKDYSLVHGMIPLGSCTMKLNATSEMAPVTWPEIGNVHPFVPAEQAQGYAEMLEQLDRWLIDITGYDAISMQPNSGASGEYAGLLAIRKYQESIGEGHRNVCLIPSSAHGTNPASAAMMDMKVVVVACDEVGNVDVADLKAKAEQHSDNLSTLMITYPSTHGVFEEAVGEICELIHQHGGQVYMDGANLNAQVGLCKPGTIGADVSHLNLHKTFAIPHGGGGPGMGPIGVKAHLAPFLASHSVSPVPGNGSNGAVAAAPYGSASILPITWMYIRMLGDRGLRESTELAILNANYIAKRLENHYSILYRGTNGFVAHECIIDIRPLKEVSDITEEDIAKRLMDYGFHAPTMSFPVPGTLMVEPTESESIQELDRFIEAMIKIREEIAAVERGEVAAEDSVLRHAPHTLEDLVDAEWTRSYSKEQAVFPVSAVRQAKFWPTVNRIDNVYGDRNFVCTCPPVSDYAE